MQLMFHKSFKYAKISKYSAVVYNLTQDVPSFFIDIANYLCIYTCISIYLFISNYLYLNK